MEKKKTVKLAGAKFAIYNECGKEVGCGVTNHEGEILFDVLPFGTYLLKELHAPCGYEKSHETFEVVLTCNHDHRTVEVINEKKKGRILVKAYGRDDVCERESHEFHGGPHGHSKCSE
ncbi:MAG: prealbumin-like fold domain-containing protein [Firmicutes bacterium]|nr:prealbumin-like fold domain-containing protein [Bacillota bacterium]